MCFIAGTKDRQTLDYMFNIMKHRAPDGDGFVEYPDYLIGMGRLAIIDLVSPGLCPYREGEFTLAFNGEIYNYIELRKELEELGHQFSTTSDTEVLFKCFKQWGIRDGIRKFNGMFAFAISDGKQIFLARDIAGEKPLYYREDPFEFASEAKALKWDCKEFPPQFYGIYDIETKKLEIKRYWTLTLHSINMETAEAELEVLLEDAIKIRTRSDVPYGLYYSGGVDSSLIKTFHHFEHLFTYEDGDFKREFLKVFPKILWHLDYPVSSFSPFGLWKLAEQAKKAGVKVVISGEGADELFGGYVRYLPHAFAYQAWQVFPSYKDMFQLPVSANRVGWDEFNGNLRELLRMGDRMTSAFGIENRCPFLDKRIIEFAFSLPPLMKIDGFTLKKILRKILYKRDPNYKDIEKTGLFCSVNKWLDSENGFGKTDYTNYQQELYEEITGKH